MKTTSLIFFSFFFLLLLAGCKKETYELNPEFTLDFNETAFIKLDGVTYKIKFTQLVEDSRCRPDSYCNWQGQVAVKITLIKETDIIIGHHTTIPASAQFKNHSIVLLDINYDKKQNFSEEKHCSVKLRID